LGSVDRSSKKIPAGPRTTQDFINRHGQIHYVALSEKHFATAKEAEREMQTSKEHIKYCEAMQAFNQPENVRLRELFDAAMENPEIWDQLQAAFKAGCPGLSRILRKGGKHRLGFVISGFNP
jgi:hypothetical protein